MFRRAQVGHEALNLEEIDDWELASEEQDSCSNSTLVSNDSNNYNSEYNLVLKNNDDQPFIFSDDYHLSTETSLSSSDAASTAVGLSSLDSNASSSESLPVIQRKQEKIKEKMRAEGRQDTLLTLSPIETVANQIPEEGQKKLQKQQHKNEAARKYRQKKKEDKNQLLTTNQNLTAKQEELKREVAHFQCVNHKFKEFLSNHECVIPPQQDNGDRMCVETGRNKVWGDDYDSCCDDSSCISLVLELMTICDTPLQFSQGSKSQRVHAIMCELQDGHQSAIVTSGASYAPERDINAIVGYNIGIQESLPNSLCNLANPGESKPAAGSFSIQETSLNNFYNVANSGELQTGTGAFGIQGTAPDSLYNGENPEGSKTGAMAYDGKFSEKVGPTTEKCNPHYMGAYHLMPYGMPLVTDVLTQTNNSSVSLMKPCKSNTINAWATGEDNQSEVEEARNAVQDLCPPPEKKFRRE